MSEQELKRQIVLVMILLGLEAVLGWLGRRNKLPFGSVLGLFGFALIALLVITRIKGRDEDETRN